ncbi:G-protein coupled receptor [Metarhizium album ARSEF 1941]|uniref:G-protein coupled receptor n=1 Tax=Metarhizium album (strain ARSEF 1941) TaxID=1081103 RepID=A0A0B2X6M5_METAS|nr:G-protein coupled receptor [Metarhizium album ARSEF 1941]KHO00941.1 G-protein coupled receptor [Metarhizium album ARSEF 1941]
MVGGFTQSELEAISAVERACSVLSLLGCLFTIGTFSYSRSFHKPINRLVFYASFGNMLTNIGTLMSRSYLPHINSFGCQFQGFLIQLISTSLVSVCLTDVLFQPPPRNHRFMPADAFWTLAMAINVYLTFYFKFDAERLRRMEIPYLIGCYGVPLVPAFVFLFVKNQNGARIYGNASLWCWIAPDWDVLRIAAFYGPVWIVIFITFFIYIRAGRTIYEKRKQLRDFHSSDHDPLSINGDAISTMKTTEITVTREVLAEDRGIQLASMNRNSNPGPSARGPGGAYSVHISADSNHTAESGDEGAPPVPVPAPAPVRGQTLHHTSTVQVAPPRAVTVARRRNHELNNAAWSYTKCSILFFTAILITWIPSSANRVYSLVNDKSVSVPLEFMSAFVLPLQGFWNAVIYAVTSWSACRELFDDLICKRRAGVSGPVDAGSGRDKMHDGTLRSRTAFRSPPGSSRTFASDSTTELAKARTHSADGSHHC